MRHQAEPFFEAVTRLVFVSDPPEKADAIFIPGSSHPEPVLLAASLYRQGLAPVVIRDLYACIRQINREMGTTIILVEQDTERALKISDSCYVMMKGAISLAGKSDAFTDQQIRDAYFGI